MNISFVIPAYNAEKTLEEAVSSIFDSNFNEGDEIIIIDDASTDNTHEVVNSLQKRYPNIQSQRNKENKGCPASRNIGISSASNPLIFNLDSDNVLTSGSVSKLKETIENEGADIAAFAEYLYFKTDINSITHRWICKTGVFTLADLFAGMINPAPGGNFLYRKEMWERIGGYWEYGKGLHEAWGFSLKMLLSGAKFVVVPDSFYYHRYSHQSLFVREIEKTNEESTIISKFIDPAFHLLSPESQKRVQTHPTWYADLNKHPLFLADGKRGINGKIVWASGYKQAIQIIRNLLTI